MILLTIIALALLISAPATVARMVRLCESQSRHGWSSLQLLQTTDIHTVTLAFHPNNWDTFTAKFESITDPNSPQYGQWMSAEEIHAITKLSDRDYDAVIVYLASHGISDGVDGASVIYAPGTDALQITHTILALESAFDAKFQLYSHNNGKVAVGLAQNVSASIPVNISALVIGHEGLELPVPMVHHARTPDGKAWRPPLSPRHQFIIRQQRHYINAIQPLNRWYGVPDRSSDDVNSARSGSVGVWSTQGQSWSAADYSQYSHLTSTTQRPTLMQPFANTGPGTNDQLSPQLEASLDVQALGSMNPRARWYSNWVDNTGSFLSWSIQFLAQPTVSLPSVISISYGQNEDSSGTNTSPAGYYRAANNNFQKIGALGITLIASSGDWGANGYGSNCQYSSTEGAYNFVPMFPASSPWVLAVGGTTLTGPSGSLSTTSQWCSLTPTAVQQAGINVTGYGDSWSFACPSSYIGEDAVDYYGSGGGFSRIFPQPTYQSAVVNAYININAGSTLPPSNYYNRHGRGYPDVAMYGDGFPVIVGGRLSFVGGTSLSAPLFAGVVSLMNEIAASHGKGTVGFVNPLLYRMASENPAAFRDITRGHNKQCPTGQCGANVCAGFTCVAGWDPVTGLGSIQWATAAQWLSDYFAAH